MSDKNKNTIGNKIKKFANKFKDQEYFNVEEIDENDELISKDKVVEKKKYSKDGRQLLKD